ncbi:MAG: acyltransferase [Verrucomicrobia bacterium]|nr:acyltransferase [Verrucomicrobiota bacterium]
MKAAASTILGRLSRVTSGGAFVPEIDGLRFVAISAVVLFHINGFLLAKCPATLSPDLLSSAAIAALKQGNFGVQLFFAISGFILAVPFATHWLEAGPRVSLPRYYLRRLTRLEPPYIVNMLLVFLLLVFVKQESAGALLPHLAASLVYLHGLIFHAGSTINYVAWSLELEVQFYLLVPVLTCIFTIRQTALRRATIALVGVIAVVLQAVGWAPAWTILHVLQFFLVGFLLADIYLVDWKRQPKLTYTWDLISIMAWSAMLLANIYAFANASILPLGVLVAYVGAFRGVLCNRILRNRLLVTIGGMCYTIYLYHCFVISLLGRFTLEFMAGKPYWLYLLVQGAFLSVVVVAFCSIFFVLFERPFMKRDWPRRILGWTKGKVFPCAVPGA